MASIQKTVSITKSSGTTAYSAGDVINNSGETTPFTIDLTELSNKPAWLLGNQMISSSETGTPTISLYLFSESCTKAADNDAFAPTDAQMKKCVATITHDTWKAFTANKKSTAKAEFPESIQMGTLYGVLVAESAYTPISAEEITCKISIFQEV